MEEVVLNQVLESAALLYQLNKLRQTGIKKSMEKYR